MDAASEDARTATADDRERRCVSSGGLAALGPDQSQQRHADQRQR